MEKPQNQGRESDSKFTPKQELFINEYLVDLNAHAAAVRAGYSEKTAATIGSENMHKPDILNAIRARMKDRIVRTECTQDSIISSLAEIADRCMQRKPVMCWQVIDGHRQLEQKTDPDTGDGIWSFNASGATRAIELLGKHLAMFTDRTEVTNMGDRGDAIEKARHRVIEEAIETSKPKVDAHT